MFINGDISVDDLGALFTIFDFNIVGYGGNEYGYWIKFDNGLMICWDRVVDLSTDLYKQFGSSAIWYGYMENWTKFPKEFIEPPITIISQPENTASIVQAQPYGYTFTDKPPGVFPCGVGRSSSVFRLAYVAFGRWK